MEAEVHEKSECVAIPIEPEEDKLESSSPFLPTHFLCPSNLGALLESTTVSLVSGGWKESTAPPSRGEPSNHGDVEDVAEKVLVLNETSEGCNNAVIPQVCSHK